MFAYLDFVRPVFLCILLAGTVLPLAAFLAERFLRKNLSASAKHRVWVFTACGLLLFPALATQVTTQTSDTVAEIVTAQPVPDVARPQISRVTPRMPEPVMPIAHVLTETAFHTPTDSPTAKKQVITEAENTKLAPPAKHWDYGVLPVASAAAWLVGACAFLLHFCVSHIRAFWFLGSLRSSSVPWGGAEICSICSPLHRDPLPEGAKLPSWSFSLLNIFSAKVSNIRVVLSHRTKIPFTFGLFRPVMVFPAEAANWPAEKVEAVFLHEKAHMVRRDLFWQNTVHVTKCFYWFHPFVRFLARRVQVEQELACDDMVLQNGRRGFAGDYAGILLELAQSLSFQDKNTGIIPQGGLAMIRQKNIVTRIESILDEKKNRRPLGPCGTLALLLCLSLVTFFVSLFAPAISLPTFAQEKSEPEKTPSVVTETETSETKKTEPGILLRFVDPDGKPIPKGYAKVRLYPGWKNADRTHFENGELFVAIPEGKPVDNFVFHCYAEGFTPYYADWKDPKNDPIPAEFTVTMEPAETIGGVVVDADGNPVADVGVRVSVPWGKHQRNPMEGFYTDLETKTDAQGEWHCTMLPREMLGERSDVRLHKEGFSDTRIYKGLNKDYLPNAEQKFPMKLTLEKGLTITGKVVDESGKPVAGAHIFSNLVSHGGMDSKNNTKTDENGEFKLERCLTFQVGDPYLGAIVADFAPAMLTDLDLRPTATSTLPPVTLTLRPGRSVTFKALDKDGKGIPGAMILFRKWKGVDPAGWFFEIPVHGGKTNENGELVWKNAPPGEFQVSCDAEHYMFSEEVAIAADQTEQIFIKRRPVKIACTAIDAETGKPIPQFKLDSGFSSKGDPRIENPDQKVFWSGWNATVGRDGKAEWVQRREIGGFGKFLLRVKAEGYADSISEPIPANVDEYAIEFKMRKPSDDDPDMLAAAVLTPDGKPAQDAVIGVATTSRHLQIGEGRNMYDPPARTDAAGKFRFSKTATGVNDQDYIIVALHDDGFVKINKEDFEKHKEPLRLQPWARIEGTLTVGDKPGKQMTMGLNVDPREHGGHGNGKPVVQFSYFQNQADDNGKFVFDRVVPGKGSVTKIFEQKDLSGDIVSWRPQILTPYEIKSGETKTVNIGGGGRPVVGKVMVPAESPDTAKRRSVFVEAKLQLFAGKSPNSGDAISSDAWQFYAVPLQKAEDRYPGWATPIAEVEKEIRDWEKSAEGQAAMAKDPELYKKARSAMDERIAVEKSREISDASVRCASVDAEGNFRIDDVTPGDWTITAVLEERNKPQDGVIVFVPPVKAEKTLTVPAGDLDEPVDVGTIELKLK